MLPRLIGIVGKARSGKTTVAEHLRDKYGYKIVSCADPLKQLVVQALTNNPPPAVSPLDEEDVPPVGSGYWEETIYRHRTPFTRWLLQFVGTDIGRALDPEIWVKRLIRELQETFIENSDSRIVIPDVRFHNEAALITSMGGQIWRTVRLEEDDTHVEHGANHASEREQEEIRESFRMTACPGELEILYDLVDSYADGTI